MEICYKGEIYYIYKKESIGSEQEGGRPGIIVSNDVGNKHSGIVEVVYLTTREKKPLPTHVEIHSAPHPSIALCEQVETVSKERIGRYINSVTDDELEEIEKALLVSFGINSKVKGFNKLKEWGKLIEEWNESDDAPKNVENDITASSSPTLSHSSTPSVITDVEEDPRYIKVCMERDAYKELYMELIRSQKTA